MASINQASDNLRQGITNWRAGDLHGPAVWPVHLENEERHALNGESANQQGGTDSCGRAGEKVETDEQGSTQNAGITSA